MPNFTTNDWADQMDCNLLDSATKLYDFILENFWEGNKLVGPDPGLMVDLRILRFIKSYIPPLRRVDRYYFLQAQGYWIRDNWDLFGLTGKSSYKEVAIACSDQVIRNQRADGSWEYPLREWSRYVPTVEGTWASLGLLESYQHTRDEKYLETALKWYTFLVKKTGFQVYKDSWTVNYFAFSSRDVKVPNNTTLVLWFFAELYRTTSDRKFLAFDDKLIPFLEYCQKPNGELVYEVKREHYLCYHYNAFEFIDLANYYNLTHSLRVKAILEKLARFLASGVTEKGSVKYECSKTFPEHILFSSVVGAALVYASTIGFDKYKKHILLIYRYLLENQRYDGSFFYSRRDAVYLKTPIQWGFLSDKNLYPGMLSYLLNHFLLGCKFQNRSGFPFP